MAFKINFSKYNKENNNLFKEDFLKEKLNQFQTTITDKKHGFFDLPTEKSSVEACTRVYEKFNDKKYFVQIGIGGSSLGPEMLVSALRKNYHVQFSFINNIDPDMIHDQLESIKIEETLFYFVSKSGGTAETMASLAIITHFLEQKGVKKEDLKNYFVFATDPTKSQLLDLGRELDITMLEVPSNIGGRFSILTSVGYLPALFAQIDLNALLDGAKELGPHLLNEDLNENILLQTASFLKMHYDNGIDQTVMMPYSSKLRDFSFWFVQLWAESLGKKLSKSGEVINSGFTPIPAYGATDQHSQVQLFMEGPKNKCMIMIEVDKFEYDFSLNNNFNIHAMEKLKDFSLAQLMKAEFNGTLKALEENDRAFIHLVINSRDERNIGGLILFFESLTAIMGDYLNIDPFDQPGVEAGKIFAFDWLNKIH